MKRDAGWAAAFLVAIATTFGLSSLQSKPGGESPSPVRQVVSPGQKTATGKFSIEKSPCSDLAEHLQNFFAPSKDIQAGPESCRTDGAPVIMQKFSEAAKTTHFIIATVPDPLHTHLSLSFDRYAEAIQQAAQESHFTYDSSWLPWQTEQNSYPLIQDQDEADDRKQAREDQPGILLFRDALPNPPSAESGLPYAHGLIVFIVGEEATGGIHRRQFENAVQWIEALQPVRPAKTSVQILGPSFSGSLPSLVQLLSEPGVGAALHPIADLPLQVYSGRVSSNLGVCWLYDQVNGPLQNLKIEFTSFQLDDNTIFERYYNYLKEMRLGTAHLAIVSEDETAYGFNAPVPVTPSPHSSQEPVQPDLKPSQQPKKQPSPHAATSPPPCTIVPPTVNPASFYYPRDISALRAAYQEQSLFSSTSSQTSAETARHTLRTDLADPDGKQDDTIRSYGSTQMALSEEAVLLHIVSMLRAHHSELILLRGSNPLDQLFLAHFFKLTYPEGRVVIYGNDLLLRRELGSSGLNGIMTLGTYPLLPEVDDWTKPNQAMDSHSHRAFPQDGAQGVYIAMRFLLNQPAGATANPAGSGDQPLTPSQLYRNDFSPPNCNLSFTIPDYSAPFWLRDPGKPCRRPSIWLSVLGSSGFAPVAALDPDGPPPAIEASSLERILFSLKKTAFSAPGTRPSDPRLPVVPLSLNIALIAVFFWAFFHVYCCCAPSFTVKPQHRSYFVRLRKEEKSKTVTHPQLDPFSLHPRSHMVLIVGGNVFLVMVCTIFAWGYGWMSYQGMPIQRPQFYALFPILIWLMAFFAVGANAWVEFQLNMPHATGVPFPITLSHPGRWPAEILSFLEATQLPLLSYTLLTASFYCLFVLAIDSRMLQEVRTLTYLRSMDLTNGVSPVVPLVLLALGMYGWCWYSLRGLALFGADRPLLPLENDLYIHTDRGNRQFLTMLADESAARPLENICWPFHPATWARFGIILAVLCGAALLLSPNAPLRCLGSQRYAYVVCGWIALSIGILLANTWQLMQLWLRLRCLLVFLDKLPLRRTLQAMRGFTWGSIWKMGGNVLDIRYKLFYRQYESLNHLQESFKKLPANSGLPNVPAVSAGQITGWINKLDEALTLKIEFAAWYSRNWSQWRARDLSTLHKVQQNSAKIAGEILAGILVPVWNAEQNSLLVLTPQPPSDAIDAEAAHMLNLVAGLDAPVRNAEETVCLLFLGFIQNILGRMRTLVLGMICLYLSIALVVPVYPFDPRPVLAGAVIALFMIVSLVVFIVYAQMFRDATLSHLTNTRPGELGTEFWLKLISFGIGPLFGLLATVFPQFSNLFLSWLQPSVSSIK